MSPSTESGEPMGKFGAALGSGAAKLGKKAAQSEAGRSAGRAAISGATDAAKDDLTNRYFAEGGGSRENSPGPAPAPAPAPQSKPKPNPAPSSSHTRPAHSTTAPPTTRSEARPPKPSVFNRFKPHIGKSKSSQHQAPVRQTSRRDRVYKYNLSREANWEERMTVQALYNYKSDQRCDLEFRRGQVIQVLTRTDSHFDWWEGELEERVGIFPANYVKIVRD